MKNKNMKRISMALAVIMLAGAATGCGANKNLKDTTISSEVDLQEVTKAVSEEDIAHFISFADNYYVLEKTTSFKVDSFIKADKNLIKGAMIDTSAVDYDKTGTYDMICKFVVNDDAYSAYMTDKAGFKANFGSVVVLNEITDKDTVVEAKRAVTVVSQEEADKLAKDNKPVYTDDNKLVVSTVKVEEVDEKELNENTEAKVKEEAKTSGTEKPGANALANSNNSSTNKPAGNTSSNKPSTGNSTTTKPSTNTGSGTTKPSTESHTHNWKPVTTTKHHDAVYETVTVVDKEAWDEPVYEERPVYKTVGVEICNTCGKEMYTSNDVGLHYDPFDGDGCTGSYHHEERKVQTGTEKVQTGTKHHPAVTHTEQKLVKAAWDEKITTGYKCSCGKTK